MTPAATETSSRPSTHAAGQTANETRFTFAVDALRYDAWLEGSGAGARICVSCPLGYLPYTAENKSARKAVLMLLSSAGNLPMARLMLTDYQHISLLVSERIDDPTDPKEVLAAAAAAVLKSSPLRRLMHECMTVEAG